MGGKSRRIASLTHFRSSDHKLKMRYRENMTFSNRVSRNFWGVSRVGGISRGTRDNELTSPGIFCLLEDNWPEIPIKNYIEPVEVVD